MDYTLEKLLEASKNPQDRSRLAETGTLLKLLRSIPASIPADLLLILRILRNLCAGEEAIQASFVNNNGCILIDSVLSSPLATAETIRVGLQLLGNVSLAGVEHRAAVWSALFPARFLELARVREPGICDTLCMVLDTCCSSVGGHRRLEELCTGVQGVHIVPEIIKTALAVGYQEEWLEWFATKICIEELYFIQLFQALGPDTHDCGYTDYTLFTAAHAFLLGLISKCLTERPREIVISRDFALITLQILKIASSSTYFESRATSALPTGFPTTDVLGYTLMILRDACAWEDPSLANSTDLVDSLISAGLMDLVLTLLQELEPPSIIRRSPGNPEGNTFKVCPYIGFRRDVVSVIANCLHRRKHVQDMIRERNAIALLLQQCVIDDDNPFQREWGLLAVRNLLEGNEKNQCYVAEFELQGSVNTPEVSSLGLKVEVDEITGRVKLVNFS